MNVRELREMFRAGFSDCVEDVRTVSNHMVDADMTVYNFDHLTEKIYSSKSKPMSADAVFFRKKKLVVCEFKGGMRDRQESYGERAVRAARENTKRFQRMDIYAKALDSYLVLEHDFGIASLKDPVRTEFVAVIDDRETDPMDEMMSIMNEASGKHERYLGDNEVDNLRKSLHNLNLRRRSASPYLYGSVSVLTASLFKNLYCGEDSGVPAI